MFSAGYFAAAYFPDGYFPRGESVTATDTNYFAHGYFASSTFPDAYFPGQEPTVDTAHPQYFAHRYFLLSSFPDPYFPGQDGAPAIPPVVSFGTGGGVAHPRPRVQQVRAWLRAELPTFDMDLRGRAVPAGVAGAITATVDGFTCELEARVAAADIHAGPVSVETHAFGLTLEAHARRAKPRRRTDDEELDAFYLASIGHWEG